MSLHGVLNVNKPDGWTSHDVVQRIRSVLGIEKVGHAGTLDPHATGVLPVLLGKGTKISQYLLGWEKEYAAVLQLGQRTDTQDAWGRVLQESPVESLTEDHIRSVFATFQGSIQQVPPMYSAVKIGGQPLYKKARKGQTVDRPAKTVVIHDLEIQRVEIPEVAFRVVCSKGTYVRTICADIGDLLQVGGHLKWLQRRRVGPIHIDQALEVESLRGGLEFSHLDGAFWSLDQALEGFPAVEVDGDDARKVLHGNAISWNRVFKASEESRILPGGEKRVRVKQKDGQLLALGKGPVFQAGKGDPVLAIETVFA
ncbi:MAG: tRNA pseudouridine(55) synthase TruB [Nitrospirota bacterium]|jgi:tRNA pseudouridine55 synthase|nr:tRNA pseudouridine(55) synthase TruB [Nitrospirota bacterium]MDH5574540.1 tRNA pseudouridine(55) synthase TruB [Nitrospirota bacterium]